MTQSSRPIDRTLDRFFRRRAHVDAGDTVLVAFSGGPDSMALLSGLVDFAPRPRVRIVAAHLDHGLDPGSGERAAAARGLAEELGVICQVDRRSVPDLRRSGESLEAAARRVRYRYLVQVGRREGARWVATAHHREDQVETVLLRILFGSGWVGLAGIQPVWRLGDPSPGIVRPLLELSRKALVEDLRVRGLRWLEDPTNRDLSRPRNLLRHLVMPRLEERCPGVADRLARLAERARRARSRVARRLTRELDLEPGAGAVLASVALPVLERLPAELLPEALAVLHRAAGASYPAGRRARVELVRQLTGEAGSGLHGCREIFAGVDCGDGLRWERQGNRLALVRHGAASPPTRFAYTLQVPGELLVEEIGVGIRLLRGREASWMCRGSPSRAALALPLGEDDRVEIRNRRPGDRLWPLGAPGRRRLKEVLIDRRVPRDRRDRLPLLIVGGRIAWVPGVTIDHRFRLRGEAGEEPEPGRTLWIAEIFQP